MIKVAARNGKRTEIMQLVDVYRARMVDVTNESLVVEITGTEDKIESMVEILRPFGIIEMVRTGVVSMTRGATGAQRQSAAWSRRRFQSGTQLNCMIEDF